MAARQGFSVASGQNVYNHHSNNLFHIYFMLEYMHPWVEYKTVLDAVMPKSLKPPFVFCLERSNFYRISCIFYEVLRSISPSFLHTLKEINTVEDDQSWIVLPKAWLSTLLKHWVIILRGNWTKGIWRPKKEPLKEPEELKEMTRKLGKSGQTK